MLFQVFSFAGKKVRKDFAMILCTAKSLQNLWYIQLKSWHLQYHAWHHHFNKSCDHQIWTAGISNRVDSLRLIKQFLVASSHFNTLSGVTHHEILLMQSICDHVTLIRKDKILFQYLNFRKLREFWAISQKLIPVTILAKTNSWKSILTKNTK